MTTAVGSPLSISISSLRPAWIIAGVVAGMRINIGGEIYVGELIAVAALPFLLLRRRLDRTALYLMAISVIWSLGQFISDLINQTDTNSMLKGTLAPIVFAATIGCAASLFHLYPRRMPSFLLGTALTLLLSMLVAPTPEQLFQPWKWGYGFAVLGIGLVWLSFFKTRSIAVLSASILVFGAICIAENARSLAMIPIAGLLAHLFWRFDFLRGFKRWLRGRFGALKIVLLVIGAMWLLNMALTFFFASGVLDTLIPADAALKYRQQASTEAGLLLSGRSESIISIRAYLDSPIIGHGSWAKDKSGYVDQWITLLYQYGISDSLEGGGGIDGSLIPAHSYLLGAMVWSGLAGGLFWVLFTFRVIVVYLKSATQLPLYFHVGLVNLLWNVLFSPFGAEARWALAVFISALIAYCTHLIKASDIDRATPTS